MWNWIIALDELLRGETTRLDRLKTGGFRVPVLGLSILMLILGATYGVCMGVFALLRATGPEWRQPMAAMVKVPLLFFATLLVTFPSLYVFNAMVGSRLRLPQVARLLIGGLAVTLAVLSSLGPITAFFSVSTHGYSFMVLLNVLVFSVAGLLGLTFVLRTLQRLDHVLEQTEHATQGDPEVVLVEGESKSPLTVPPGQMLHGQVRTVFRIWLVVFGLVGAQMSWILRPFIGDPNKPFEWFRMRDSNFFEAVWQSLIHVFH